MSGVYPPSARITIGGIDYVVPRHLLDESGVAHVVKRVAFVPEAEPPLLTTFECEPRDGDGRELTASDWAAAMRCAPPCATCVHCVVKETCGCRNR